jgi:hypothetical protein
MNPTETTAKGVGINYEEDDEKLWAELMQSMESSAKMLAMSVPKGRGKMVLAKLGARFGSSSAAVLCQRVTKFVNQSTRELKKSGLCIEAFVV